ncbi:MAG: hypothetical protein ACUVWN_14095 [bacterium]
MTKERDRDMKEIALKNLILISCLFIFIGCGIRISQEKASLAVDSANKAIESARELDAETYSIKNLKMAEKLFSEAENAFVHNRLQRAYMLATRAEKLAKAAEEEARQYVAEETGIVVQKSPQITPSQQPGAIPPEIIIPPRPIQQEPLPPKRLVPEPSISDQQMSDIQNRIQSAVQALDAAQKAVDTARLLVFKIMVDFELSKSEQNIQQLREANAPQDVINLIRSWYNQAQRSASNGNYETALRFIQRAQTYTQAFTMQ